MESFWKGFEKRAMLPGGGVTKGLFSHGGLAQAAAKVHPLPTANMKMPAVASKRVAGPGAGSMAVP